MDIALSPAEQQAIAELLGDRSEQAGFSLSLEDVLNRWQGFVEEVERGYADSIYEYENDLAMRDILEEVAGKGPPTVRERLKPILDATTARFLAVTRSAKRPLGGGEAEWWSRIPVSPGEELEEDLRSEGLV